MVDIMITVLSSALFLLTMFTPECEHDGCIMCVYLSANCQTPLMLLNLNTILSLQHELIREPP